MVSNGGLVMVGAWSSLEIWIDGVCRVGSLLLHLPSKYSAKKANGMPAGKEWKYIYSFVSLLNNVQIFQVVRYLYKLQITNLIVLFIFSDMNNQLVLSWYLRQPELHRKD